MDQRMPGRSPFDLSQTGQVASFEVAISMLEFPQGRFGRSGMKYVADCTRLTSFQPEDLGFCRRLPL